mgnify:CR=1 FL=1
MNGKPLSDNITTSKLQLNYLKTIGILNNSAKGRGFGHPVDLAVNNDGHIYVLNRHAGLARIGICTLEEEYLGEFGSYGHADGQFWLATAIAIDSQKHVYVTDEYHHNVTVFQPSGELIGVWGNYGAKDGQLNGPSGIAIDFEDNIFVVELFIGDYREGPPDGSVCYERVTVQISGEDFLAITSGCSFISFIET